MLLTLYTPLRSCMVAKGGALDSAAESAPEAPGRTVIVGPRRASIPMPSTGRRARWFLHAQQDPCFAIRCPASLLCPLR